VLLVLVLGISCGFTTAKTFSFSKLSKAKKLAAQPLFTKMNPTSCLLGSRFVKNPFSLLAVVLLFVEKTRQSAALFWFGLRIVGFLQIFYSQAVIPRTTVDSPAFLEHGLAEKIVVCANTTRDSNKEDDYRHFCMKRLGILKSFQIFKTEIKKLKTYIS
jgi:hypothetical protein